MIGLRRLFRGVVLWVSVRIALDRDDMTVVKESIHGGAGEQVVPEERWPFVNVAIGGDDDRAWLVPLTDHVVEVERLVVPERSQTQVVEDKEVGLGVPEERRTSKR